MQNWAANYTYGATTIHRPANVGEIQEIVARAQRVKALGTRHSFNDIADTAHDLISMEHLDQVVGLDREKRQVTVEGGIAYGRLCTYLNEQGFALHNLASLPHISVSGACATATHGSGEGNGSLSTAVAGLEIVKADGTLITLSRQDEEFAGAVVGLGALGIVTKLTLDVLPAFEMNQVVYEGLPLAEAVAHFDEIEASGYSVSLFTTWSRGVIEQVWIKRKGADAFAQADLFGAKPASGHRHPIGEISPVNCTPQMGIPGPWHERMPHFRMDYTPSSGEELQAEYFVPRQNAVAALQAIDGLKDQIVPLLQISEVRTIAADDLWMSPCYRQPSVAIHFTWKKDWDGVRAVLPIIEERLREFGARPHWGKLFTMSPGHLYEKLPDFKKLVATLDPGGKFGNGFLERCLYAD